jgi:hypothetical protein
MLPSSGSIEIRAALDWKKIAPDRSHGGNDSKTGQRFVGGPSRRNLRLRHHRLRSCHRLRSPGTNQHFERHFNPAFRQQIR